MSAACLMCDDKGAVRHGDAIVECGYCPPPKPFERLHGFVRCRECSGQGHVVERSLTTGGGEMVHVYRCDRCSGSGRIDL